MHLIVSTHKLGELPTVIESIRRAACAPQSVVISCDALSRELLQYTRHLQPSLTSPVVLVQRVHKGVARRGQTRNNGVRAIQSRVAPSDMLYFLDGDVCPDKGHFAATQRLAQWDVLIGRVMRLSQPESKSFKRSLRTGTRFGLPLPRRIEHSRKVAKAKLAAWLRRLAWPGLSHWLPPYWPDLRSGNFAVRASTFFRVNGFDEALEGWGAEDSDLGLRLYAVGARVTTFPWGCQAYHLWHPSPAASASNAGLQARLSVNAPRPKYGLEEPFDQLRSELQITS